MNTQSTFTTALLRSLYLAVIAGCTAGLTAFNTTNNNTRAALITGALAALAVIGGRGGIEGTIDSARQGNGQVAPSDVQPLGEGKV